MKYTVEKLPESRVAIDVEVEPEAVEQALGRAARRIAQRARIPGFRPGKAPRYIVEMHFGREALYEDAGEEFIQQTLKEVVDKGEVVPVGQAEIEKFEMEPFTFRLIVPVRPTVTLGDYRALRFSEEVQAVSDEDVAQVLKRMQDEQTVWTEPDPLRPAVAGDRLVADIVGKAGEKEIENRKAVEIVVGEEGLLPGFEALAGAEVGQTLEVNTTLPEGMEDKELAGKPAVYVVTVHGIKEPEVPALDDEFARNYGQGEQTLDELRTRLRRDLEEVARKQAREKVLLQMLDAVVDGATVDMPQAMVKNEAEVLFEEQAAQLRGYNLSMEQYFRFTGQSEEEYRKELAEVAPGRLRRYLVLRELIRAEDLPDEGTELQEKLEERLLAIARGELEPAPAGEAAPVGEEGAPPSERLPSVEEEAPAESEEAPATAVVPATEGPGPSAAEQPSAADASAGTASGDETP